MVLPLSCYEHMRFSNCDDTKKFGPLAKRLKLMVPPSRLPANMVARFPKPKRGFRVPGVVKEYPNKQLNSHPPPWTQRCAF